VYDSVEAVEKHPSEPATAPKNATALGLCTLTVTPTPGWYPHPEKTSGVVVLGAVDASAPLESVVLTVRVAVLAARGPANDGAARPRTAIADRVRRARARLMMIPSMSTSRRGKGRSHPPGVHLESDRKTDKTEVSDIIGLFSHFRLARTH
jgi:hypothetical protein